MNLLRNFIRPARKKIPFKAYVSSPEILIMDVTWVDYFFDHTGLFYNKFPPRDIIEVVTHIPTYMDYESAITDELEVRFSLNEHDQLPIDLTELLVMNVVTMFYDYMNEFIPDSIESYIFLRWVDRRRNEIIMTRQNSPSRPL